MAACSRKNPTALHRRRCGSERRDTTPAAPTATGAPVAPHDARRGVAHTRGCCRADSARSRLPGGAASGVRKASVALPRCRTGLRGSSRCAETFDPTLRESTKNRLATAECRLVSRLLPDSSAAPFALRDLRNSSFAPRRSVCSLANLTCVAAALLHRANRRESARYRLRKQAPLRRLARNNHVVICVDAHQGFHWRDADNQCLMSVLDGLTLIGVLLVALVLVREAARWDKLHRERKRHTVRY